jgi:hypothetical protein
MVFGQPVLTSVADTLQGANTIIGIDRRAAR